MAYDETLAYRVRKLLLTERAVDEIKMFGGICYKVDGFMACGVLGDDLIVKCDPGSYETLLTRPHAKEFAFTGRPLRGILLVGQAGLKTTSALRKWLAEGIASAKAKAQSGVRPKRKSPSAKARSFAKLKGRSPRTRA